jgi:hypothetical protein
MHLFGGMNMGMDWYGEQARQGRNASVYRDINFVHELKDRLGAVNEKERDREVHKLVEMMQARDRKEELAKAKAEGSKEAEERLKSQGRGFAMGGGGGGMIGGGGMGGGGIIGGGGGGGGMGFAAPTGVFPFNTPNPFCPVHGQIYGRPCYHCQALGRGVAGYFSP